MPVCICKKEYMMKYGKRFMHIYNFPFVVPIGDEVWRWCRKNPGLSDLQAIGFKITCLVSGVFLGNMRLLSSQVP